VAPTFRVLYSVYSRIVLCHPSTALPLLAGVGTRLAGVGTRLAGVGASQTFFPVYNTTPMYNSDILLRSTEPTTDYRGRFAYHVYYNYYSRRYRGHLCLQSQELREVSFQELLVLYKNTSLLQPGLRHIIVNKIDIIVLES
jgi:hypothetical protein